VKNDTVSSSAGSIQNVVLADPLQPTRIQAYLGRLGLGLELAHRVTFLEHPAHSFLSIGHTAQDCPVMCSAARTGGPALNVRSDRPGEGAKLGHARHALGSSANDLCFRRPASPR